ncbi:MAG: hypothetical protein IJW16_02120 [Clostridia bacterium]|nr:hypothetical protein [Clostridia bacterium]
MARYYIDIDAAYDVLVAKTKGKPPEYCALIEECTSAIDDLPPADVRPLVHAHWIKRGNEKICSAPKCKFIYYSNNDDFNYCPNCGAVMDGKE